jgi:hypothetical protein
LGVFRGLRQFNDEVYSGEKRDVICASIVQYRSAGDSFVYAFEMPPTDGLTVASSAQVRVAFDAIQRAAVGAFTMSFRPTSLEQKANVARANHPLHNIPQVDISSILAAIDYTPIVRAETYGKIRILENATSEEVDTLTMSDIVVFQNGIPNDIPPVAGVILREPLPPLCHVALLCRNRRTPCAYVSKTSPVDIEGFANRWVLFRVHPYRYEMCPAASSKKNDQKPAQQLKRQITLPLADQKSPVLLSNKPASLMASSIGAKAFQLWQLNKAINQAAVQFSSFAIPFGAYMEHIKNPAILAAIEAVPVFSSDSSPPPSTPVCLLRF